MISKQCFLRQNRKNRTEIGKIARIEPLYCLDAPRQLHNARNSKGAKTYENRHNLSVSPEHQSDERRRTMKLSSSVIRPLGCNSLGKDIFPRNQQKWASRKATMTVLFAPTALLL